MSEKLIDLSRLKNLLKKQVKKNDTRYGLDLNTGKNWQLVDDVNILLYNWYSPVAFEWNGAVRLVVGSGGGGVRYSDDGGATWTQSSVTSGYWYSPVAFEWNGAVRLVSGGSGGGGGSGVRYSDVNVSEPAEVKLRLDYLNENHGVDISSCLYLLCLCLNNGGHFAMWQELGSSNTISSQDNTLLDMSDEAEYLVKMQLSKTELYNLSIYAEARIIDTVSSHVGSVYTMSLYDNPQRLVEQVYNIDWLTGTTSNLVTKDWPTTNDQSDSDWSDSIQNPEVRLYNLLLIKNFLKAGEDADNLNLYFK